MDVAALAASFLAMQAGATQQAMATKMIKMNMDAEKVGGADAAAAAPRPANLAAGVGGNLDISV